MDIQTAIRTVIDGHDLSSQEMLDVMRSIMTGEATAAQIGGFLVGLRIKGETVDELSAAAQVMRDLVTPVDVDKTHLVDTCGTGGDGANTFNISTASAFVVAAAGGRVAKHGNRSVSSSSGSADVLEAAGVKLDLSPEQVAACIAETGIGFMFAPAHHSAMKHAIGPRRELGVRTVFNLLGPLTNPAGSPHQVMGVFDASWLEPLARVLGQLGSQHVMIVNADDGMDEISISAATQVAELKNGRVECYQLCPEDFGMQTADSSVLAVASAEESLQVIRAVLDNAAGPARDIVQLNAGAAIYVAGLVETLEAGISRAGEVLASGAARDKLQALIDCSNRQ